MLHIQLDDIIPLFEHVPIILCIYALNYAYLNIVMLTESTQKSTSKRSMQLMRCITPVM